MSLATLAGRAFAPVQEALTSKKIPGAALGLLRADGERVVLAEGFAQIVPVRRPLTRATFFDLASLTKVIVTTQEILRLVQAGQASLDAPIKRYIPDLFQYVADAPIHRFTLRQLLSHQSGLVAVAPIYTWGNDPATLLANVLQRDWPIGAPVYSDINFILLGVIVERLTGRKLREVALPPGLTFAPDKAQTAATEYCHWRERVMVGEVHDENAWALGGIAGHAGLFGTVDGVLDYAALMLKGETLPPSLLMEMARDHGGGRGLGWEVATPGWSGGDACSSRTIGHTGFTGTGLWINLEREVAWTLLTNRVHPSRHADSGIGELRRLVAQIVGKGAD